MGELAEKQEETQAKLAGRDMAVQYGVRVLVEVPYGSTRHGGSPSSTERPFPPLLFAAGRACMHACMHRRPIIGYVADQLLTQSSAPALIQLPFSVMALAFRRRLMHRDGREGG